MAESASRNWRATLLSDLDASIQKFHSLAGSKFDGELVARELNRWFKLIRDGGADPECLTCHGDPAVCATVPGLRHCEAANRDQSAVSERGDSEYICRCGIRVVPHRCQLSEEF